MNCIYLAAGLGVRMKENKPKQFINLLGKPVFIYALEILEGVEEIDRILLMYHPEYKDIYQKYINDYNISKVVLIEGGLTRQRSVINGLKEVKSDRVIIHEAARPFISKEYIKELLKYKDIAVVPTIPISFSVAVGSEYMEGELDRTKLHNIQLPQVFNTDIILKAHLKAEKDGFIANEDGILVYRFGKKVKFVNGIENNIKVTTPLDIVIAEKLIKGIYQ